MRLKRSYFFLAVSVLPLLLFFNNPALSEPVHNVSLTLMKPFLVAGHSVVLAAAKTRENLVHFWNAFRNQSRYESRIAELESKLLHFEEMKRENERLSKIVDFKKTFPVKTVAARIIGWNLSPWRKTVILDKGKDQGIRKDMTVVIQEGLAGRVTEVGPATAQVLLLVDPDARVTAVADQSRVQGVIAGDGTSYLYMNYLDLESPLAVGETVLTSGVGGLFPKGFGIGKIESVTKTPDGLHLIARVQPFVSFSKLEEVLCLEFSRAG